MSSYDGPRIVTTGLVLCLDAAEKNSYSGTGTTWRDLSGNGYNGTLQNGIVYNGFNGGILYFDGVDDYVSIGNIGSPQTFSCCFWINVTELNKGVGNDYRRIIVSSVTANFILIEEAGQISFRVPGVNTTNYTSGLLTLNRWSHVCCTYDQTYRRIYQDGNLKNEQSIGAGTVNFGTLSITDVSIQSFKGYISSLQIYNKNLSPAEIKQNYNVLKSRFGL